MGCQQSQTADQPQNHFCAKQHILAYKRSFTDVKSQGVIRDYCGGQSNGVKNVEYQKVGQKEQDKVAISDQLKIGQCIDETGKDKNGSLTDRPARNQQVNNYDNENKKPLACSSKQAALTQSVNEHNNQNKHDTLSQAKSMCLQKNKMLAYSCNFQQSKKTIESSQKTTKQIFQQPIQQQKVQSMKELPVEKQNIVEPIMSNKSEVKPKPKKYEDPIRKQLRRVYDL